MEEIKRRYMIPDNAGAGARYDHSFVARFVLADYTEHIVLCGTVSAPQYLEKDNIYREGAELSDSPARLKGWLQQQLPWPQTALPGSWSIIID